MTPETFLSGLIGAAFMGILAVISMIAHRRTLLACAREQTAERLIDGKFYYLVAEARYNQLLAIERGANLRVAAQATATASHLLTADSFRDCWVSGVADSIERDVSGAPKLPSTVLEIQAIDLANSLKAWADGQVPNPLPEELQMQADLVLDFASLRRQGVRA